MIMKQVTVIIFLLIVVKMLLILASLYKDIILSLSLVNCKQRKLSVKVLVNCQTLNLLKIVMVVAVNIKF